MKLLIIGANGMLGGSLHRYFSSDAGYQVMGSVRSLQAADRIKIMGFNNIYCQVEASKPPSIITALSSFKPDYVLNCVGIIKQLSVSDSPVSSIKINSLFPHELAEICSEYKAKLIHFSTDCVFSGETGYYQESDIPDARDIYGKSKLLGEVDYGGHLTLRTSIIGHEIDSPISLIGWFLSQKNSINGYDKAIFSGFPTVYVAEFLDRYVFNGENISGLYHFSSDPISKHELLKIVNEKYSLGINIQRNIEFKIDRSLNSNLLRKELSFTPPSWNELVDKMHREFLEYFV
ncbi:SDR family NAD(P)-dependent oxidoreductase [Halomonas sp. DQ26W]|nr:SDR family NAD(P)-dependent oxidoreductase [Halomonas sp. DQ26W]